MVSLGIALVGATVLTVLAWLGLVTPNILLALCFVVGTLVGVSAIVWGEIDAGNYSPIFGLVIAAAGFPVHHLWRRTRSMGDST